MRPLRFIQGISLGFFILSLGFASGFPGIFLPPDMFLKMDPIVLFGAGLAARTLFAYAWIVVVLFCASAVFGRFFCSYICPMGITIDWMDNLFKPFRKKKTYDSVQFMSKARYLLLFFIAGSSLLKVSFVFWISPMALATRFYGTVLNPIARLFIAEGAVVLRMAARGFSIESLSYAVIATPRFMQVWATVAIMLGVIALGLLTPRFFCRYLCPSGALFSMVSLRPLLKRSVGDNCSGCGRCRRYCPMDAIAPSFRDTDTRSCITCRTCVMVCPEHAVAFTFSGNYKPVGFSRPRREFFAATAAGAAASLITLSNALGFYRLSPAIAGPRGVIRPPGAVPEPDFLARCVRCGACMAACPTNTLQPIGLPAGFSGLYSPAIVPALAPCDPECNRCGSVCPTNALTLLSKSEKIAAKVGTARIQQTRCLAWEQNKPCLVCDEVCPFDAVQFRQLPDHQVAVPTIIENKCWGCGYCESRCPVRPDKAIIVEPYGALRLKEGSYIDTARQQGLDLSINRKKGESPHKINPGSLPPGFTD